MKLSMKSLAALLMMLNGAVMASENVNTPENRQFLKQQENLSRQLREKPDHQLKAWAEKQVLENPLQRSDNHFLDEVVRKQQASQDGKPRQGALYFVSFSIPEEGLKRMLGETRHGTVAKLAMRQPFVLFKGLTFQKLCLPGAFRPGDHHNKMLRPGLCVVHASPQYL